MSALEKTIKRRHFPVRVKLSAVRDRLIGELDFTEVLIKYGVSSSTFRGWLNKYKSRVMSEESYINAYLYLCMILKLYYR